MQCVAVDLFADGVDVGVLALAAALPQPALHGAGRGLQVVVRHLRNTLSTARYASQQPNLEIAEVRESGILWQRTVNGKLDFLGVDVEPVPDIDSHL